MMGNMSLNTTTTTTTTTKASAGRASFGASVDEPVVDTPSRRVRGAGPSSIIFG
jgi:hypothetical protein